MSDTEYLHTVTAICPSTIRNKANNLACVLGTSVSDLNTYPEPQFQKDGIQYSVVSFAAPQRLVDAVTLKYIIRPDHDTENQIDMVDATEVLNSMVVVNQSDEEFSIVQPNPGYIVVYVNFQPHNVINMLGLTLIQEAEIE